MPENVRDNSDASATHTVTNQATPLEDVNLLDSDRPLSEALDASGAAWASESVRDYGEVMGSAETIRLGRAANANAPELQTHDRYGNRIDEVEFHPAWHEVMRLNMKHEVHNLPWRNERPGAHAARTAKHYMLGQIEAGSACPITMTFACVPALRHQPDVFERWKPLLLGTSYDGRAIPATEKSAITIGMAMTEKQGGSDVRANTTRAVPVSTGGPGREYELTGHKWFCSAPMSDAFLTLAQTDAGLGCFLVPRRRPDGTRNPFRIQRLKSKLGNRSNASSEIEYRGTHAELIGDEGRGVRTIIEMVHHTRLDCVSGSAGLMRRALAEAVHHANHRSAFGKRLIEQPLMRNVLADLALEVEAATALMMRLARSYDEAPGDDGARAFARLATAVGKYWVCKRAPHMIYEAMECLGGNGYVEESDLPRLYREAPVNAIWEGSGNVICLDVLRAMVREPDALPALLDELRSAAGASAVLDRAVKSIESELADPGDAEFRARRLVEKLALALQAALLVRSAPAAVADAFIASRLDGDARGLVFGELDSGTDVEAILQRALPTL